MSTEPYKTQAARLAQHLAEKHGIKLKKSSILESVAALYGHRDWNALIADPVPGAVLNHGPSSTSLPEAHIALSSPEHVSGGSFSGLADAQLREKLAADNEARTTAAFQNRSDLVKLGWGADVAERWVGLLQAPGSGLFVLAAATANGKTTFTFATTCMLQARGVRVATVNDVEEYPKVPGSVAVDVGLFHHLPSLIACLREWQIDVVTLAEAHRHLPAVQELVSQGFKVVSELHASDVPRYLNTKGIAGRSLRDHLRAACYLQLLPRCSARPDQETVLPLATLEVFGPSGDVSEVGVPAKLRQALWSSRLDSAGLRVLADFVDAYPNHPLAKQSWMAD